MKIIEKDEQHMVIGGPIGVWYGLIFGLVFGIALTFGAQFIPIILMRVLFSAVGVMVILLTLRALIGMRIVIDKPTQTVMIMDRSLFLTSRQRTIPFSEVQNVVLDYEAESSGGGEIRTTTWHDAWKVSLDIGDKKLKIDYTTNEAKMFHLASDISSFIGTELEDNSAKPESPFGDLFGMGKGLFRKDDR